MTPPVFNNTQEAISYGQHMGFAESEYLETRRRFYLDSAKDFQSKNDLQEAIRLICLAQFDREAIEAYNDAQITKGVTP